MLDSKSVSHSNSVVSREFKSFQKNDFVKLMKVTVVVIHHVKYVKKYNVVNSTMTLTIFTRQCSQREINSSCLVSRRQVFH